MSPPAPDDRLDPRAWLLWGAAASFPALLGRNPFPLLMTLVAVLGVRLAWADAAGGISSWAGLLRLAAVFTAVGVVFNVLTVRSGDNVLFALPDGIPILGGDVTVNALVFGALGGLALITLVLIGTTLGGLLDWSGIVRLLPPGLTTLAVAGSVAFAFIPQTAIAFGEIREAQAARGHRVRSARDLVPLLAPLLTGGMERALTLAESLESRGFGAPLKVGRPTRAWRRFAVAAGLAGAACAAYLFAAGRIGWAGIAGAVALLAFLATRRGAEATLAPRTRYRQRLWSRADTLVAGAAVAAIIGMGVVAVVDPRALRYEPYPTLAVPRVSVFLLLALALLFVPALVAPTADPAVGEAS